MIPFALGSAQTNTKARSAVSADLEGVYMTSLMVKSKRDESYPWYQRT